MKKFNLHNMHRGWFIGNFKPSVLKTKKFEVGYLKHFKNQKWPDHVHKKTTEYNLLVRGEMVINNRKIKKGEIFVINKGEVCRVKFLKNCELVVVKVPSNPLDKFEV